jgi:ElaB/YqjD/DUF883 family membrane-anchored ribosome-binding protein
MHPTSRAKTLKALKSNAENALKHSRHLISDAYEESKVKIRETGVATRDYAQEHPWTTAGVCRWRIGPAGGLPAVQNAVTKPVGAQAQP